MIFARSGMLLWLGAGIGLWTVSSLIETIRDILRRAYRAPAMQAFWMTRLFSAGLILAAVVVLMLSLFAQMVIGAVQEVILAVLPQLGELIATLSGARAGERQIGLRRHLRHHPPLDRADQRAVFGDPRLERQRALIGADHAEPRVDDPHEDAEPRLAQPLGPGIAQAPRRLDPAVDRAARPQRLFEREVDGKPVNIGRIGTARRRQRAASRSACDAASAARLAITCGLSDKARSASAAIASGSPAGTSRAGSLSCGAASGP